MKLYQGNYFHIYNRSNNNEIMFKSTDNYRYFLKKYRHYLEPFFTTISYCLMPTHFHLLVYVHSEAIEEIKKNIGLWLSSYTKAINKMYKRHGSLFQEHTKASLIKSRKYLLLATAYIHWNPVRAGLVENPEDWIYSSYRDYIGVRKGTLPNTKIVLDEFNTMQEFIEFSKKEVQDKDVRFFTT